MKIITPSVEIMRTGLEKELIAPEQFIEKVGRTCYKSEDKITDDSAVKFVGNLISRGHEAVIEHYSPIFKVSYEWYDVILNDWIIMQSNAGIRPYLRFTCQVLEDGELRHIVSGNMRAWRDYAKACLDLFDLIPQYLYGLVKNYPLFFPEYQNWVPDRFNNNIMIPISVRELTDSERRVHQDITMKFTCDRGVSHELVRHRVASFAQESTRYCNYSLDKFGKEITVVRPSWCEEGTDMYDFWKNGCLDSEHTYFTLLDNGATPQQARSVLPNSLKTEVIVTMNRNGWYHFFELRCSAGAHPDMREVAEMAREMYTYEMFVNGGMTD